MRQPVIYLCRYVLADGGPEHWHAVALDRAPLHDGEYDELPDVLAGVIGESLAGVDPWLHPDRVKVLQADRFDAGAGEVVLPQTPATDGPVAPVASDLVAAYLQHAGSATYAADRSQHYWYGDGADSAAGAAAGAEATARAGLAQAAATMYLAGVLERAAELAGERGPA